MMRDSAVRSVASTGGPIIDNPLLISWPLQWVVMFYLPLLATCSLLMNGLALRVLKSEYLQDLISQPILKYLLSVHILLPIIGPFYVWMVQVLHIFLNTRQVYPCFLLLALHGFFMVSSAWTLVLIIVERAITLSKSKPAWNMWHRACGTVTVLMLGVAMVMALGPLMIIEGTVKDNVFGVADPICLPWWGHGPNRESSWFHFTVVLAVVGPCLVVVVAVCILLVALAKFCAMLRWGCHLLEHYQTQIVTIKSAMHFKFIPAALWLGLLFVVTAGPLGFFVVLSVALDGVGSEEGSRQTWLCRTQDDHSNYSITLTVLSSIPPDMPPASPMDTHPCTRRADMECVLWMLYYSFSMGIVPVLVASEGLFRREWKGQLRGIAASVLCLLGQGQLTHPMTLQLKANAVNSNEVSTGNNAMQAKLDPTQNANLECYVNESPSSKYVRMKDVPLDDVTSGASTTASLAMTSV